jgi:NADH-quinone oxidoreductase subunit D
LAGRRFTLSLPQISGVTTQQLDEKKFAVSIGPQHPGAGHFRFTIVIEGDIIVEAIPDPGYVHRGAEKQTEYRNYTQCIPLLERSALNDTINIIFPFCMCAEEIMGVEVPERAQYLRIISSEIERINSHLYWLGIQGIFLGHSTMFMWPLGDREVWIDLLQLLGGARRTTSYIIPGGVRNDMPFGFKERVLKTIEYFTNRLKDYERIFLNNPLVQERSVGVGVLSKQDAVELGATGPVLRASDVKYDTRKAEPYSSYQNIDFEIPSFRQGDVYSRFLVHFQEFHQSMKIIRQAIDKMPSGPVRARLPPQGRGRPGEAIARTEAGRGQMLYYVISDGGPHPYRVKYSVPSFRNLIFLPKLLEGAHVADMPAIYWSLDYWPVEADK